MSWRTTMIGDFDVSIYEDYERRCVKIYPYPPGKSDVSVSRQDKMSGDGKSVVWVVEISWSSYGGVDVEEAARFSDALKLALLLVKFVETGDPKYLQIRTKEVK